MSGVATTNFTFFQGRSRYCLGVKNTTSPSRWRVLRFGWVFELSPVREGAPLTERCGRLFEGDESDAVVTLPVLDQTLEHQ